jgi:hypothetical protein
MVTNIPEGGGSRLILNTDTYLSDYMALQPRSLWS